MKLQKTLQKKEKMLITSIISMTCNVFYPSNKIFNFSVMFILSSAHALNLDRSRILLFTKWQNFRPVQFERLCRQQNKCDLRIKLCFGKERKHCRKGENAEIQTMPTSQQILLYQCFPPSYKKLPFIYSITCIQRPLRGKKESGRLQQVIFNCRFF